MDECPKCGSENIGRYVDDEVAYNYCADCGKTGQMGKVVFKKGTSDSGLILMGFGAVLFLVFEILRVFVHPDFTSFEDRNIYMALVTILSFIGICLFLFGSIIQMYILLREAEKSNNK
jgi:hypothetical protein